MQVLQYVDTAGIVKTRAVGHIDGMPSRARDRPFSLPFLVVNTGSLSHFWSHGTCWLDFCTLRSLCREALPFQTALPRLSWQRGRRGRPTSESEGPIDRQPVSPPFSFSPRGVDHPS